MCRSWGVVGWLISTFLGSTKNLSARKWRHLGPPWSGGFSSQAPVPVILFWQIEVSTCFNMFQHVSTCFNDFSHQKWWYVEPILRDGTPWKKHCHRGPLQVMELPMSPLATCWWHNLGMPWISTPQRSWDKFHAGWDGILEVSNC